MAYEKNDGTRFPFTENQWQEYKCLECVILLFQLIIFIKIIIIQWQISEIGLVFQVYTHELQGTSIMYKHRQQTITKYFI